MRSRDAILHLFDSFEGLPMPTERDQLKDDIFALGSMAAYAGAMEPIRIAHLTDQHVGRITPFAIQRQAVALTNAERPDLVVITGDFVCHSQSYLAQLVELVRGFHAPVA